MKRVRVESFRNSGGEESFNFAEKEDIRLSVFKEKPESTNCFGLCKPLAIPRDNKFHWDYSKDPSGSL